MDREDQVLATHRNTGVAFGGCTAVAIDARGVAGTGAVGPQQGRSTGGAPASRLAQHGITGDAPGEQNATDGAATLTSTTSARNRASGRCDDRRPAFRVMPSTTVSNPGPVRFRARITTSRRSAVRVRRDSGSAAADELARRRGLYSRG